MRFKDLGWFLVFTILMSVGIVTFSTLCGLGHPNNTLFTADFSRDSELLCMALGFVVIGTGYCWTRSIFTGSGIVMGAFIPFIDTSFSSGWHWTIWMNIIALVLLYVHWQNTRSSKSASVRAPDQQLSGPFGMDENEDWR